MAGHLLALGRCLSLLGHTLAGVAKVSWAFPRLDRPARQLWVQGWAQTMLRKSGIAQRTLGQPAAQGPVLLVANHLSWLDIPTLHAGRHCRFISKAEVANWPLIGRLAKGAGTLFIQRGSRRDASRLVQTMAERLRAGDVLAVFPEATTGDGRSLLPFHPNLLQAAIDAQAPVQPVALRFIDLRTGEPSFIPCFQGDESMLRSLWRTLRTRHLLAVVHYGELEYAQGRDRRQWALDLHARVNQMLQTPWPVDAA